MLDTKMQSIEKAKTYPYIPNNKYIAKFMNLQL